MSSSSSSSSSFSSPFSSSFSSPFASSSSEPYFRIVEQLSPLETPYYDWWLPNPQASDYGTPSVFRYETNLINYQLAANATDNDALLISYDPLSKTISLKAETSIGKEGKVGGKASIKLNDTSGISLVDTITPGFYATRQHTLNTLRLPSISQDIALQFYERAGLDVTAAINAETGLITDALKAEYALGMKLPFYGSLSSMALELEAGLSARLSSIDNYSTPIDAAWKAKLTHKSAVTDFTLGATVVTPIGDSQTEATYTLESVLKIKRWKLDFGDLTLDIKGQYKGSIGKGDSSWLGIMALSLEF